MFEGGGVFACESVRGVCVRDTDIIMCVCDVRLCNIYQIQCRTVNCIPHHFTQTKEYIFNAFIVKI